MLKVLIQIILLIAFVVFLVMGLFKLDKNLKPSFRPNKLLAVSLVSLVGWLATMCVVFIPANTVGIKWSAFTGTSTNTLNEGPALKTPFDVIYQIPTTVQERTIDGVSVQTKDAQWVSMSINVKYQVNPENAFKVFQNYETLENLNTNLIANVSQRAIEEVTTQYNIIEVLGEKRNDIYIEIENILREKLAEEAVTLKFITIKDTDAGEQIEQAIADEAVAKKEVETAEQQKQKAEIEAETKLIEAEGEAKANEVKTKQLTDEILAEMWINKWDGKLPLVSDSNGNMIDISGLLNDDQQ